MISPNNFPLSLKFELKLLADGGVGLLRWTLHNRDADGRPLSQVWVHARSALFVGDLRAWVGELGSGEPAVGTFSPRLETRGHGELEFAVSYVVGDEGIGRIVHGKYAGELEIKQHPQTHQTIIVDSKIFNAGEMQFGPAADSLVPLSDTIYLDGAKSASISDGFEGGDGIRWRRIAPAVPSWLMLCPLTQGEWEEVSGRKFEDLISEAKAHVRHVQIPGLGPAFPLYYIRCGDAGKFCKQLAEKHAQSGGDQRVPLGYEFRLPTEEEWWAACGELSFPISLADRRQFAGGILKPVGKGIPNANGFHDMLGGVFEICCSTARDHSVLGGSYYPSAGDTPEKDFFEAGKATPIALGAVSSRIGLRVALAPAL